MSDHSFDIVSKIDMAEVTNAVTQTVKEISQRYDLKDDGCELTLRGADRVLLIQAPDEFKSGAVLDILKQKLAKRSISLKALMIQPIESALGGRVKQEITIQNGIASDKAKWIAKDIKDLKAKVQVQIQGDQLRVSSKSIDELQRVMQLVKTNDYGIHVGCDNLR